MKEIKEQCRQNGLELDFERARRPKEYIGTYVLFEVALEYCQRNEWRELEKELQNVKEKSDTGIISSDQRLHEGADVKQAEFGA
jgi:hypothetical protein